MYVILNPDKIHIKCIILYIYLWLCWVSVAARGFSSSFEVQGAALESQCAGFSLRWLLLLGNWAPGCYSFSSRGSWAPEHRLNSRGSWASLLDAMWELLRSGVKPVSPAVAGGFFTTWETHFTWQLRQTNIEGEEATGYHDNYIGYFLFKEDL